MRVRWRQSAVLVLALAAGLAGCGPSTGGPSSTPGEPRVTPSPAPPSVALTAAPTEAPDPTLEPPPGATLVTGGRRLTGEVGSYVWAGGSESAPWLPVAALETATVAAGRGELEIEGGVVAGTWSAVAARADDPQALESVPLGEGDGTPSFDLPDPGSWVVAVEVAFEGGLGDAVWYWSLTVE